MGLAAYRGRKEPNALREGVITACTPIIYDVTSDLSVGPRHRDAKLHVAQHRSQHQ